MATRDPNAPAPPDSRERLVEDIVALWEDENGWIPGAAINRLSAVLGIPLRTAQEIGRARHTDCSHPDCVNERNRRA